MLLECIYHGRDHQVVGQHVPCDHKPRRKVHSNLGDILFACPACTLAMNIHDGYLSPRLSLIMMSQLRYHVFDLHALC